MQALAYFILIKRIKTSIAYFFIEFVNYKSIKSLFGILGCLSIRGMCQDKNVSWKIWKLNWLAIILINSRVIIMCCLNHEQDLVQI